MLREMKLVNRKSCIVVEHLVRSFVGWLKVSTLQHYCDLYYRLSRFNKDIV